MASLNTTVRKMAKMFQRKKTASAVCSLHFSIDVNMIYFIADAELL